MLSDDELRTQPKWAILFIVNSQPQFAKKWTHETLSLLKEAEKKLAIMKTAHPDLLRLPEINAALAESQAKNDQTLLEIQSKEREIAALREKIIHAETLLQTRRTAEKEQARLQIECGAREAAAARQATITAERVKQEALFTLQYYSKKTDGLTSDNIREILKLCHVSGKHPASVIPWGDLTCFANENKEELIAYAASGSS